MPYIDFEVYCSCGNGLCNITSVNYRNGVKLEIEPCPECMEKAESEGYSKGYEQGADVEKATRGDREGS